MMVALPAWVAEEAAAFWHSVACTPTYPCDLAAIAGRAYPVAIFSLTRLSVERVERWLQQRGIAYCSSCAERPLHGCLLAVRGHGLIFVDRSDPPEEQRYTLAHELAHFLHDYLQPRQHAIRLLGPSILPVLDGERPPTFEERLDAILASCKLGFYLDLLPRTTEDMERVSALLRAERGADRLALELLAPAERVLSQVDQQLQKGADPAERRRIARHLLMATYGLPPAIAQGYAALLFPATTQRSIAHLLGFYD
ncbi:ImmA/IrrE family metallo-endopeptidase [Thermogemmatispora tikiterensis]|uniref:ImmA/IrrE family metallo-endopeptidase n=1 Tax=Thermogemmatispora tikiterensis TaxID=1825093 RepID=UPI000DD92AB2|nr:ImmA/IrrE family metallo-endopeptidase [Thermogemmatispora tikiterensis]